MPLNRDGFRKWRSHYARKAIQGETYLLGVFLRKNGIYLGRCDVSPWVRGKVQSGSLGYTILNQFWGNGFGKEAVATLMPGVLLDLGLNRLEAIIDRDNRASIALARSAGLKREGIRRRYYYKNGRWVDQVVY